MGDIQSRDKDSGFVVKRPKNADFDLLAFEGLFYSKEPVGAGGEIVLDSDDPFCSVFLPLLYDKNLLYPLMLWENRPVFL